MRLMFLILVLIMSSTAFSQDVGEQDFSTPDTNQNFKIQKLDEFGPLPECDRSARIDNFLVKLSEQPSAKGYIIYYQGKDILPSELEKPEIAERSYMDHIKYHRFDMDRIVLVSSYREETATELWIVPQNAEPPKPTDTISKPKITFDKTLLYDRGTIDFVYDSENYLSLLLPQKRAEYEEMFKPSENFAEEITQGTNTEETKLSAEELEEVKFSWTSERFGAFLEKNKNTKGVIMYYADDHQYDINKVNNFIEEGKQRIAKAAKINPERMQVIFGGYKNYIQIEFWAVPEKGIAPTPKPDERIIETETENEH